MTPPLRFLGAAVCVSILSACASGGSGSDGIGGSDAAPVVTPGPIAFRRLTSEQYARSVHDVLGAHIEVPSRIDPDTRRGGLAAVGASFAGVSASGFEKYEEAALSVARQALDSTHRGALVPCTPASTMGSDDTCASEFVEQVGRRLFRRPLTPEEVATRTDIARASANTLGDFYRGLELALSSLLVSPHFLFRVELAESDPSDPSRQRLTGATVASRLSYFLWNTTPDDALLEAAESGALVDPEKLIDHVERMIDSENMELGTRSFYTDVHDFSVFDDGLVVKDALLFPVYSQALAEDAKEQTLRTIVAHLAANNDYRDLFTTRETFLTPSLAEVYDVPFSGSDWQPYTFDPNGPRAGLLSHASLMALHSHPGRSSPTLRGKFVREVLLCQDIPTPPPNIDFSIVENTDGELRTARERLSEHVTNDGCANCHSRTDPIGLALENFDAIGAYRTQENGVTIDTSGDLDGTVYDDAIGLGEALRDHPSLGPCLTLTLFRYAVGRDPTVDEWPLLEYFGERFAAAEFRVSELVRDIVLSEGFVATSGPRDAENAQDTEEAAP